MSSQWQPGQSGNPKGRPKKEHTIRHALKGKIDKEKFVEQLLKMAYAGNERCMKMVLEYVDGTPAQVLADEGQVNTVAPVILLPSNGHEFQEEPGGAPTEDDEDN